MKAINVVYFQKFINNYKTKQEEQANKGWGLEYFGPKEMQMLLDKLPTIEVEPVRRGWWITTGFMAVKCSECKEVFYELGSTNYCPNCGAKMDLKE